MLQILFLLKNCNGGIILMLKDLKISYSRLHPRSLCEGKWEQQTNKIKTENVQPNAVSLFSESKVIEEDLWTRWKIKKCISTALLAHKSEAAAWGVL